MKIEVDDIDEIFDQIIQIAPPTQKDDHKFLNALRKQLEKNVIVNPSLSVQNLEEKKEEKDLCTADLAFSRKELPAKFRLEFIKEIHEQKEKLLKNSRELQTKNIVELPIFSGSSEFSKMIKEMENISENINSIIIKLDKARNIIDDVSTKVLSKELEPFEYAEVFFRSNK